MGRKDTLWNTRNGTYIETVKPTGYDVLINGTDRYLNFKDVSGEDGYGFRDNAGVMEVKDDGGNWVPLGSGGGAETFETVSKNLKAYPYEIAYSGGNVSTITYDLGGGLEIVKTFGYTSGDVTSITLSGNTPVSIDLVKTISYVDGNVDTVSYS